MIIKTITQPRRLYYKEDQRGHSEAPSHLSECTECVVPWWSSCSETGCAWWSSARLSGWSGSKETSSWWTRRCPTEWPAARGSAGWPWLSERCSCHTDAHLSQATAHDDQPLLICSYFTLRPHCSVCENTNNCIWFKPNIQKSNEVLSLPFATPWTSMMQVTECKS